jgi:GH15 family glucan-1,4-alpha-glucosidase
MRHKKRYRHSFVVGAVSVCSAVILLAVARWRKLRDLIHRDVCKNGFNQQRNAFVQYYGGDSLDAALLMIPLVGFLSPHDARVVGTVEAIQRELTSDGLVMRYRTKANIDRLPCRRRSISSVLILAGG